METLFEMNPSALWSLHGINVLVQVTIIAGSALVAAMFLRRRPAERHAILLGALLLILGSPLVVGLIPTGSIAFVQVSVTETATNELRVAIAPPMRSADMPLDRASTSIEIPSKELSSATEQPSVGEDLPHSNDLRVSSVEEITESDREFDERRSAMSVNHRAGSSTIRHSEAPIATVFWLRTGPAILLLWLLGTLFLLSRLVFSGTRLSRLLKKAGPVTCPRSNRIFADVCRSFGIRRPLPLLEAPGIAIPFAAGLSAPRVVLPFGLCESVSPEALEHLLLHEVAHVVRRDPVVVLLQNVASALFWFHPLVHPLNRQLGRAREELCDNHVLGTALSHDYSRTLLLLAEGAMPGRPLPGGVGLFTSGWRLESRIAGILDEERVLTTRLTRRQRASLTALVLLTGGVAAIGTVSPAIERRVGLGTNTLAHQPTLQADPSSTGKHRLEFAVADGSSPPSDSPPASVVDNELDHGRVEDPDEKRRLIGMLAEADRKSRDSIVTWSGSGSYTASEAWQGGLDKGASRVVRQAQIEFAIDRKANRLAVEWTDMIPPRIAGPAGEWRDLLTKHLTRYRSLVNENDWYDFRMASPYRGPESSLFLFDASATPRVLTIRAAVLAQSLDYEAEGLINPTLWTSISGRHVHLSQPYFADHYEWLKDHAERARLKEPDYDVFKFCDVLRQRRDSGPVIVFRQFTASTGRPVRHAPDTLTNELTFDERLGFALTRCEFLTGRKTMEVAEIDHERRGDSIVPIRFSRKIYQPPGAPAPTGAVEVRLQDTRVNEQVAEARFDIDRLGLREGTESSIRNGMRGSSSRTVSGPPSKIHQRAPSNGSRSLSRRSDTTPSSATNGTTFFNVRVNFTIATRS